MLLPPALDYKRALDGDQGGNCDGMGSVAPHPADGPALREELRTALVDPLVRGLRAEGLDFTGFVYLGAMLTARGPVVIEINTRFGDSEAQVVLPGLRENFTGLCRAVLAGGLDRRDARHDGRTRCSLALVQGHVPGTDPARFPGWPFGAYVAGQPVSGLRSVDETSTVFYAGVRRDDEGRPVTSGGRVLHVVGSGTSLADAREAAYRDAARIAFPGLRYRGDIGAVPPSAATVPADRGDGRRAAPGTCWGHRCAGDRRRRGERRRPGGRHRSGRRRRVGGPVLLPCVPCGVRHRQRRLPLWPTTARAISTSCPARDR